MNQTNILKGMVAGLVATAVLSALMVVKTMMGVMPELDVVAMLTKMIGASSHVVGWMAHFVIGTVVWGGLFAWLDPSLPGGSHWIKGMFFGIGAWLLMMIAVMPMASAGVFGLSLGMMAPVMTLVLHVLFGIILGGVYGAERPQGTNELQVSRQ